MAATQTTIKILSSAGCPLYTDQDAGTLVGTAVLMTAKPSCAVFSSRLLNCLPNMETWCRCMFGAIQFILVPAVLDSSDSVLIPPVVQNSPLFKGLSAEAQSALALGLEPQFLNQGDIINQDTLRSSFGIVVSGKIADEDGNSFYPNENEFIGLRRFIFTLTEEPKVLTAAASSRVFWVKYRTLRNVILSFYTQDILQLQRNIDQILGAEASLGTSGRLGFYSVSDLLAAADASSFTGQLKLELQDGQVLFQITDGFVKTAEFEEMDATEVILRFAETRTGIYRFQEPPKPKTPVGSIDGSALSAAFGDENTSVSATSEPSTAATTDISISTKNEHMSIEDLASKASAADKPSDTCSVVDLTDLTKL